MSRRSPPNPNPRGALTPQAMVGKYDAGMATHTHTPAGRGFDHSLIYYEHKNDYYDQT